MPLLALFLEDSGPRGAFFTAVECPTTKQGETQGCVSLTLPKGSFSGPKTGVKRVLFRPFSVVSGSHLVTGWLEEQGPSLGLGVLIAFWPEAHKRHFSGKKHPFSGP